MIVLIPSYEPDHRLVDLVRDLRAAAPAAHLVVVDDGSGPLYASTFAAARHEGAVVLVHERNRGKGAALKTGFAHVQRTYRGHDVVCADSDGQHSVVDVVRVAAAVADGEQVVLGSRRFAGPVPARSRLGNGVTRVLFRLATGLTTADTQTGLRGYRHEMLPWLQTVPGERFEYELNLLLQAARRGISVTEVEIATIYLDHNASSHFRPVADSARIYGPLLGFLLSSMTAFVVDLVALLVLVALTGSLLPSVVGARVLSASVNFTVNRHVVFAPSGRPSLRVAAGRYAALAAVLLVANAVLLSALTAAGVALLPAKVATELLLLALSYQAQRRLVFVRWRERVAVRSAARLLGVPVAAAPSRAQDRSSRAA